LQQKSSFKHKLGARLALVCFGWSILIACIVTFLQVYQMKLDAHQSAADELLQIEKSFIPAIADALWTIDEQRFQTQLNALKQLPNISKISLTTEDSVVTSMDIRPLNNLLAERQYSISIDIEGQHFDLGTMHIQLDAGGLLRQQWLVARTSLFTSFMAMFLSSLLLLWLFHRWVSVQLHKVSSYASQLNAKNLTSQLVLSRPTAYDDDEIGRIVLALAEMQQQLLSEFERRSRVEDELLSHQSKLETAVSERTEELMVQKNLLETQSKILLEQNTELNAFAHTVAHDLKHPLTSLIGLSTLLSQAFDVLERDKQQEFVQQILRSSLKMNTMINSLLQLASLRLDAHVETTLVDMNQTVIEAKQQLGSFINDHQPKINLCGALPMIRGNASWIEEIWLNYLSNAIKYGGQPAQIDIGFTLDSPQGYCRYWVRDYGPDSPKIESDKLFIEFSRLDSKRADSHGLGLSIVRRICQKLGGLYGYEPAEGGGSRFWFALPNALGQK
jgi:signal transduction histidine kinase